MVKVKEIIGNSSEILFKITDGRITVASSEFRIKSEKDTAPCQVRYPFVLGNLLLYGNVINGNKAFIGFISKSVLFGSKVSVGFGVVSLSLGNSRFPF